MFEILNKIGWWISIVVLIGAFIFYIYEKHIKKD
jgi:hypothetical protein